MDESTRTPTACDVDKTKQQLLAQALAAVTAAQLEAFRPPLDPDKPTGPKDPTWKPGVFEQAAVVRAHLPAGLEAGDFDGFNIEGPA